ncbi:hypothetical protein B0H14DRAFT_3142836, partial [Mycena olivaceomarginata]
EVQAHILLKRLPRGDYCDPTPRAALYFVLFGVFYDVIHEGICTAIHAAFSHPGVFSSHGVVAPGAHRRRGTCVRGGCTEHTGRGGGS